MDYEETGHKDKHNNPIHIGDILQIGLGIGDRTRKRVIKSGSRAILINPDDESADPPGYELTETNAKQAVIVDHQHPPYL